MGKKKPVRAFSLFELSVVLLIIALIGIAVPEASRMINRARLNSARVQTESSPVALTEGLILWLETTSKRSFEVADVGDNKLINRWSDIVVTKGDSPNDFIASDAARPIYVNRGLNGLPVVKFNGSTNVLNSSGNSLLLSTNSPYTIFYVAKNDSNFDTAGTLINLGNAAVGYDRNSRIENSDPGNGGTINPLIASPRGTWHAVAFAYNGVTSTTSSNRFFVDGIKQTVTSIVGAGSPALRSGASAVTLGGKDNASFFKGELAELVIYDKTLDDRKIAEISSYLIRKWKFAPEPEDIKTCLVNGEGVDNVTVGYNASVVACNATGYIGNASFSSCNGSPVNSVSGCEKVTVPLPTGGTISVITI